MAGLPAAGKDTWLARNRPNLPVVSLDDLAMNSTSTLPRTRARWFRQRSALPRESAGEKNFALSATNTVLQTRRRWIDLFADYGAAHRAGVSGAAAGNNSRGNERRDLPVPKRVIERLVEKLEPATLAEAHSVILVG